MKACNKCKKELPESEFRFTVKQGKPYRRGHCIECQRAYTRAHYVANKEAYVERARVRNEKIVLETRVEVTRYLADHPCVDCGENDLDVLQFDHRDPANKLSNISELVSKRRSWAFISKEVEKCDVRCANCHMRRTRKQFSWWSHESL